jgi:hypothetical protein
MASMNPTLALVYFAHHHTPHPIGWWWGCAWFRFITTFTANASSSPKICTRPSFERHDQCRIDLCEQDILNVGNSDEVHHEIVALAIGQDGVKAAGTARRPPRRQRCCLRRRSRARLGSLARPCRCRRRCRPAASDAAASAVRSRSSYLTSPDRPRPSTTD